MTDRVWQGWARISHQHAGKLLGLGVAVLLASLPWAAQLYGNLHTDIRELLPQGAPAAVALDELEHRIDGLSSLTLVVQADEPKQGQAFVDALAKQIRQLPAGMLSRVDADLKQEQAFSHAHGALYADTSDLQTIADGLQKRKDEARKKANPFHVEIDDDPPPVAPTATEPKADDLDAAVERLRQKAKQADTFPSGYFASEDGKTLIVQVKPLGAAVDLDSAKKLFTAVDGIVQGLHPTFPKIHVGYSGEVRGVIEAQQHLVADMLTSSVLVLVAVSAVLLLYFGHLHSLPQLILPLFIGATATFAVSRWVIEYLNPNTAFLGSIIVGNGINAGIILLGRYDEQRRQGQAAEQAWQQALSSTWLATLTASGAAALSYGALGTVQFRGFNQFGFIGFLGMITCWLTTYAWLPAVTTVLERWRPNNYGKLTQPLKLTSFFANLVTRHAPWATAFAALLAALAVVGALHFSQAPIEHNLQNLGSRQGQIDGEAFWGRRVDAVMRSYQTPTVILTDSPAQAEQAAAALRTAKKAEGSHGTIDTVRTLQDFLPADQQARLPLVGRILALLQPANGTLGQVDAKLLQRVRPDLRETVKQLARDTQLTPVTPADLPLRWGAPFHEKTGHCLGCIALVYPTLTTDASNGQGQVQHAQLLRETVSSSVPGARIAGTIVLTSDINRAITVDGRGATLLSLLAVALITFIILRSLSAAAWVVTSLAVGVLWMFGALGWLGIKLNFVNFAVMPITFGIGIDYAVNYVQRYRQVQDAAAALRSIGGAVALCSATTIIGYATLITADNRAVQSFGISAVLGEITCLSAALLLTPALLAWRDQRVRRRANRLANDALAQPPSTL